MQIKRKKYSVGKIAACALLAAVMTASGICGALSLESHAEADSEMYFNKIAAFDTGNVNADGGTAEIVHYNSDNNKMYLVNGADQSVDIVSLESYGSGEAETVFDESADRIKIADIVAANSESFAAGFEVGDIASVAVSTQLKVVAVAVQHSDYASKGAVVLLDYDGNFVAAYETGVQPDNVCISGNYILTADEGEPREGYTNGTDPKGSVTIVSGLSENNLTGGTAKQVYFDSFDAQRDSLTESGVIIMKGANPSTDFEPEYIVSSGNGYAYVSLQEANAIAILDIEGGKFTAVQSLGFKDHSLEGNGLDLIDDGKINITTENVYGVYMPDGMDIYTAADGTTYLITANEGDAREWGEFSGVTKVKMTDENGENSTKVEVLDNTLWDGLDEDSTYVLGGRSFSVFKVTESSIEMVYDSGDGIEQTIAASDYSAYFNCNNDDISLDARSKKKGPEPEDVTVYEYDGKVCVSVCMERQSGFVTFDISDIVGGQSVENVVAASLGYTTTRDFSADMAGDVAPENLEYVAASENALGKDLIIMANENSGTVSVYAIESTQKTYELHSEYAKAETSETQSTEGSALITSYFGTGDNTDGAFNYSFVTIYNNSGAELDLSGWTIQYKSSRSSSNWQSFTLETVLNVGGTYTVVCAGASGTYSNSATLTSSNYDAVWSDLAYFDNKTASVKIVDANGNTVDALGIYLADESYSASDEEGEGSLVSDISKNKVIYRNASGDAYADTDDNSADFSVSSKLSSASKASAYTPAANESAQATAYVAVNADNATVSGISYLASGYVLAGDITFTVTPETDYKVASVAVGNQTLTADNGVYSLTLSGDCTITVTCESVYAFELNDDGETYALTGINDDSITEIIIPSEYNGATVTAIASGAFKNNKTITYLYIPESITSIGNYAFYGCTNLEEIYYGAASVTLAASNYIFYQAGQSGDGIAVTIGKTVEQIPAYLFNPYGVSASYAPKITSVTFEAESACESVGDRAFAFCSSLTAIALPESLQTLGEYVFYGCSALESASFGGNLTTIGTHAFYSCAALKTVTFANTFGWYKGQSTTLTNNGYAVCVDVTDGETNAANFTSTSGWLSYKLIRTENVISYYVDGELYGAACYSTSITSKQFTNLKSAISVTTVPSKTCYKGAWDTSVTYKTLQSGGTFTVTAFYTANHTLENIASNAATCTEDGNTEYWYCTVCEKYFSDESGETEITIEDTVISAIGHSWNNGEVTTEATCTSDGVKTYTCSVCGVTKTEVVEATGHKYESVVTAPTCTEKGYTTYTCAVCGDSYVSDETEATGHKYISVVTAPTCTEKGYTTYTCAVCGDSYVSDETEAASHKYESVVTAPTCTEKGYTTYTCTVCGDSYISDETEAAGHKYESVVTAPTCTEKGYTTYTCAVCGNSYVSDETEATGHKYALTSWTWDGVSSATALLTCENDGHTETATAEITSEITTEATETAAGVITYTATVTFEGETYTVTKTETIPATGTSDSGASGSDGTESSDGASGSDNTGSVSGSGCATFISGGGSSDGGDLYLVLTALAVFAIAAAVSLKKGLSNNK